MLQDGRTRGGRHVAKTQSCLGTKGYVVGGWREREKLNVEPMPRNSECSKSTKWPKRGALLCDHVPSQGEKELKDVLTFDSLLVLCHAESGRQTVSAACHKTLVVRNHIKKIMEGTNVGTRISGCHSLKWNLALGILSNPSSIPLLSPYLWPSLIFHCFQLQKHEKSFKCCHIDRKVLILQRIMLKRLSL